MVFVGYQAECTLGRRLVNGAKWVRIFGRDVQANAQVHTVGGLSAHADQHGLLEWYGVRSAPAAGACARRGRGAHDARGRNREAVRRRSRVGEAVGVKFARSNVRHSGAPEPTLIK